jgi:hypothetical protein
MKMQTCFQDTRLGSLANEVQPFLSAWSCTLHLCLLPGCSLPEALLLHFNICPFYLSTVHVCPPPPLQNLTPLRCGTTGDRWRWWPPREARDWCKRHDMLCSFPFHQLIMLPDNYTLNGRKATQNVFLFSWYLQYIPILFPFLVL